MASLTVAVTPRTPLSPGALTSAKSANLISDDAVALQVQQFLDDWQYRLMKVLGMKITATQAKKFSLEILALNGVGIGDPEIKDMLKSEESKSVYEIVRQLPMNIREDFDHLALQLQMLVTTTARVRKSIEDGNPEQIQETIEEVDSTSIGQQILKQAVVQASREVAALHRCQETWFRSMEKRLDRLTRSAELAEYAQQQLLAVETQLQRFGAEQNEKSKKALMGLAETNDKSLLHTTFGTWLGIVLASSGERAIRKKYEQEIANVEKQLWEYKEKSLRCVKGQIMASAGKVEESLMHMCLDAWMSEIAENKRDGVNKETLMALESKLAKFQTTQSDNTKKVMARMGADQDATLVSLAWSSWMKFSEDYKKDKEFEDKVKATEQRLNDHKAKKKEEAQTVLNRINGATDSGLMALVFQNWYTHIHEHKKVRDMEERMQKSTSKLKDMRVRQKGNAMSFQGRVNEQIKANLLLKCVSAWMLESKVNHIDRYYTSKMNHKRQQLASVQTLFKSFAKQLEDGLGNIDGPGDSSGRSFTGRSKAGMQRGDHNSVSLPDIHARPTPAS